MTEFMTNDICEQSIIIPKDAWSKEKVYYITQDNCKCIANIQKSYRWRISIQVENIEKYDIIFEDDTIDLYDVFEALDNREYIKLEKRKKPQKDIKITLIPSV